MHQVADLPVSLDAPTAPGTTTASVTRTDADALTVTSTHAISSRGGSNTRVVPNLPGLFTGDNQVMPEAVGFGWDGLGFDLYWRRAQALGIYAPKDWPHSSKNPFVTLLLLAQYMATKGPGASTYASSSADPSKSDGVPSEGSAHVSTYHLSAATASSRFEALEALVNESMPAPAVLAAFDRQWCSNSRAGWGGGTNGTGGCCGIADVLGLASRTFLRLGRRSEAEDTAWLAVQPSDSHGKGGTTAPAATAHSAHATTTASASAGAGAPVFATEAKPGPPHVDLTASASGATRKAGSSTRRSNSNTPPPPPPRPSSAPGSSYDHHNDQGKHHHHHPKVATRVTCRCVLGDIAASEANWLVAEGYYAEALADARACEARALEVMVCSKWRYKVLQPAGKSQAEVEVAIEEACKRMNCNRDEVAELLQPEP